MQVRRLFTLFFAVLVAAGLTVLQPLAAPTALAVDNAGASSSCGYGSGGPKADVICWLDMSGFDYAMAASTTGQAMTAQLTDTVSISFTVHAAGGIWSGDEEATPPLVASAFPTWSGASFGNAVYRNVRDAAGNSISPALATPGWQAEPITITLDDIVVHATWAADPLTAGYGIVLADAESTNAGESVSFDSGDAPLSEFLTVAAPQYPGYATPCEDGLTVTSSTITCSGTSEVDVNDSVGAIAVLADAPTTVSTTVTFRSQSKQGLAFGFLFSKIGSTVATPQGKDTGHDAFSLAESVEFGGSWQTVRYAESNAQDATPNLNLESSAIIVEGVGATNVRYTVAGLAGTDLSRYDISWSCTIDGVAVPKEQITLSADGAQAAVTVAVGQVEQCDVVLTPLLATPSSSAPAEPVTSAPASATVDELVDTGSGTESWAVTVLCGGVAIVAGSFMWAVGYRRSRRH